MADWNMWRDKAINLTRIGVSKAKDMGEIARLNLDNLSEEEKIRQAYIEIGERYMELHQDTPEEAYRDIFQKITTAKANIVMNKDKIARIKADGDITEEDMKEVVEDIALDQQKNTGE